MEIEFAAVSPALARHVSAHTLCRTDTSEAEGITHADCGRIVFLLDGECEVELNSGETQEMSRVAVTGPGSGARTCRLGGPHRSFAVSLTPIGWGSLVSLPADDHADRIVPAEPVLGEEACALAEQLATLESAADMAAAVEPFLAERARPVPKAHLELVDTVDAWMDSATPAVERLYAAIELSPRQATRLINHYFGGPPKLLERKVRATRAALALLDGAKPDQVVGRFYDQSHMIRELRHFVGHTPKSLRAGIDPLLAASFEIGRLASR